MSLRPIVTLGDPVLRQVGEPIDSFGPWLHTLLDDMTDTMRDAPGVGLAAQQIGLALQVCVIEIEDQLYELVNPRLVHLDGVQEDHEGCLSVPGFVATRARSNHAVMTAQDRHGRRIRLSGSGLLARAMQHEYDHLQGELYLDDLPDGTEIIPVSHLYEDDEDDAADGDEVGSLAERSAAS